jgi:hypothetical protein
VRQSGSRTQKHAGKKGNFWPRLECGPRHMTSSGHRITISSKLLGAVLEVEVPDLQDLGNSLVLCICHPFSVSKTCIPRK